MAIFCDKVYSRATSLCMVKRTGDEGHMQSTLHAPDSHLSFLCKRNTVVVHEFHELFHITLLCHCVQKV